jgi:hypothetical protein
MTARAQPAEPAELEAPDFSRLSCPAARRRVAQLIAMGLSDNTVADLVGWDRNDVRRALDPHAAVDAA